MDVCYAERWHADGHHNAAAERVRATRHSSWAALVVLKVAGRLLWETSVVLDVPQSDIRLCKISSIFTDLFKRFRKVT